MILRARWLSRRWFTAFMSALVLLCATAAESREPQPFVVGWKDWAPHQFRGIGDDPEGVNIELIKEMARRAGFRLTFKEVPWNRGLHDMQEGFLDIAMSALKNSEREEFARFSSSWFKLEYNVMFVRKSEMEKWSHIRSLKDTIGTQFFFGGTRGSIFSDEHDALAKDPGFMAQIQEVNSVEQNMEKLMRGRINGFIADEIAGAYMLKKTGYDKEVGVLFPLYGPEEAAAYLMFGRKSVAPEDVEKFDAALDSMKTDGTYDAILQQYLPERAR